MKNLPFATMLMIQNTNKIAGTKIYVKVVFMVWCIGWRGEGARADSNFDRA